MTPKNEFDLYIGIWHLVFINFFASFLYALSQNGAGLLTPGGICFKQSAKDAETDGASGGNIHLKIFQRLQG